MHLGVHHVGLDDAGHVVVGRQHDVVDVALARREASADGVGARVVRAVVVDRLGSGVAEQQAPLLQHAVGVEVVERLAVLRDNRGERDARAVGLGHPFDGAGDFALDHTRTAHLHGQRVHAVANLEGALHLLNLLGALLLAHLGDGHHQLDRLVVVQQFGLDAQQRRELELRLAAVGGQVVDPAPQRDGLAQPRLELGQRMGLGDAHAGAQLVQRGLRAGPDDVLDREVVAVERLVARVDVDDADERRRVEAEEVEERRVLAEVVCVVRIVVRREGVAREHDESLADFLAQRQTACGIGLG